MDTHQVGRILILFGILVVAVGILLYADAAPRFLGRLPGDVRIERESFRLYVPLTTSLLISAGLTALFWLISRLR